MGQKTPIRTEIDEFMRRAKKTVNEKGDRNGKNTNFRTKTTG